MIIQEEDYGISTGQRASMLAPTPKISPEFWGDVVPSAFRLENPVSSAAVSTATSHPSELYDPNYDAFSDLGEFTDTREAMDLIEAKNPEEMRLMKQDLARQKQDEQTINDAGGLGTLASVMAGVASPTTLIPGFALVKGGKAVGVASGALRGAASATTAIGIDEALLQQSQVSRSPMTSAMAVTGGVVLGGLLGGGVSSLSKKQFSDIAAKVERDVIEPPAIQPSKELGNYMKSVGAAMVEKPTLKDLTISGAAALTVSRASRFVNPFNRLANSPFTTSRETLLRGFETTLEFNLHRDGKTLGPAAETQIKLFDKYNATAIIAYKENFKAFKQAESTYNLGQKISGKEFRERLSRALRNGDVDPEIQEVTKAAQRMRKEILDPIKDQAIEAGLLPKDVSPAFAKSYLHRMWDRQKLLAYRDEAMTTLTKWAEGKVNGEANRLRAIITDAEKQLGKITATKRDSYSDAFKKVNDEYATAAAAQKEIATRLANYREQIAKNNAAINKLKESSQTPEIKAEIKKLRENKQKLSVLRKEVVAQKKSNATMKSAISERKAKIETEYREARVKAVGPDEVLQNTKSLEERIYKTRLELEGILDPDGKGFKQAAGQTADEIYAKLTGIGSDTVPGYISPITRGPLKEKLLDIADNDAEMFLKNDAVEVLNSYVHKMGSDISLSRAFGRADMKDQLDALAKEYQEALGKTKTAAERRKLEKAYRSDESDLQAMRDLLRGHFNKHDPDSMMAQGGIALRDISYMTSLGGVTLSSMPDIARHTMVHGIQRSFGDLLDNINLAPELKKMRIEDLKESGFLTERVLASRLMTLADVNDPMARGTMLTRVTGSMAQGFSKLTLINHWNDLQKAVDATLTQNRILRSVTSETLNKSEVAYLRFLGIDDVSQRTIAEQYAKHGAKDGEAFIAGIKNWDDTPAVRQAELAFKAALRKEADTAVVSKGVADAPIISNTPLGKMLFQFTGFLFASHQRILLRGLQQADAGTAMGLTMIIAMGSLVAAIKQMETEKASELSGRPLYGPPLAEWDTAKLLYEGVDRSSVLGLLGDFNNRLEKMGVYGLTRAMGVEEPARYTNRNKSAVVFGPAAGKLESLFDVSVAPFDNQPMSDAQIRSARSLMPFQNITGIRFIFDEIQGNLTGD
jgi:hypothetical protein